MEYIVETQRPAFPVFEPFFGGFVTANVEIQSDFRDTLKVLVSLIFVLFSITFLVVS